MHKVHKALYLLVGVIAGILLSLLAVAVATTLASAMALGIDSYPMFRLDFLVGLFVVPCAVVGGLLGGFWAYSKATLLARWMEREKRSTSLQSAIEQTPLVSVRSLQVQGPARQRICGRIVAFVPTMGLHGRLACASETLPIETENGWETFSNGGVFCLEDHTGSLWVDARCVAVAEGWLVDEELCVPPGVLVEVCGTVESDASLEEHMATAPYRSALHSKVLTGNKEQPVLVRVRQLCE